VEAARRALSREHLLERVWGYSRGSEIESRTVDVPRAAPAGEAGRRRRSITTLKGVGYGSRTSDAARARIDHPSQHALKLTSRWSASSACR